ncbi:MAG TPA: hypothetical protein ENJ84_10045 [Gammaproteobacteria bacterium]|nr:hypothetical protein [Gammaproteobacteria bacterium]
MNSKEFFYRGAALGKEARTLPAQTYNQMHLLFQRSGSACLFIPIRNMQYQAIIDHEEVIFVDAHRRTQVEFSWQQFRPQARHCLTDPVPYQFVYYLKKAPGTMQRMQGEFSQVIQKMGQQRKNQEKHPQPDMNILHLPVEKES